MNHVVLRSLKKYYERKGMKYPYIKFYFRDWQSNSELQTCSIEARGVWIELMCIMAQSERYGYLERNGNPMDDETISRLIRVDNQTLKPIMMELEKAGVFSRCSKTNSIYSRRMVRDCEDAQKFIAFGRKGGNPSLKNLSKEISNTIPIPTVGLTHGLTGGLTLKNEYGEFKKVKLTTDEYGKLQQSYGEKLESAIDILDSYMASKGKKYSSCYATMKKNGWVWKRVFEESKNTNNNSSCGSSFSQQKPASFFASKEKVHHDF